MYSDIISSTLDSFHLYLSRNTLYCRNHPAARVSVFWNALFSDRLNFPNLQEFMTFRRSDFICGIGDTKQSNPEQKFREFSNVLKNISLFIPQQFLQCLQEPTFGAPQVFASQGICQSASFILNAGTSWRVSELIRCFGTVRRPLHIAEIGAGWGACAYQLHHVADVGSYTVIDLPENLCLSSVYLNATLPRKISGFVDCAPDTEITPLPNHLYFALPPAIDNLPGRYDVLLNTFSFQEMDKETVSEYFKWAARSLSNDGILVSFNSHDKEGIKRPSEYLTNELQLVHMQPFRKMPTGFFNTIPYEMVFCKVPGIPAESVSIAVDSLGEMMQLGLDGDLVPAIQNMLSGQMESVSLAKFRLLRDFFYAADEEKRSYYANELMQADPSPAILYLVGSYRFASGDLSKAEASLEESLKLGLQDFAAIRAKTLLTLIYQAQGDHESRRCELIKQLETESGGLYEEIRQVIKDHNLSAMQNHIGRVLDCPVAAPATVTRLLLRIKRCLAGR